MSVRQRDPPAGAMAGAPRPGDEPFERLALGPGHVEQHLVRALSCRQPQVLLHQCDAPVDGVAPAEAASQSRRRSYGVPSRIPIAGRSGSGGTVADRVLPPAVGLVTRLGEADPRLAAAGDHGYAGRRHQSHRHTSRRSGCWLRRARGLRCGAAAPFSGDVAWAGAFGGRLGATDGDGRQSGADEGVDDRPGHAQSLAQLAPSARRRRATEKDWLQREARSTACTRTATRPPVRLTQPHTQVLLRFREPECPGSRPRPAAAARQSSPLSPGARRRACESARSETVYGRERESCP